MYFRTNLVKNTKMRLSYLVRASLAIVLIAKPLGVFGYGELGTKLPARKTE
jgi:hypothetical protein